MPAIWIIKLTELIQLLHNKTSHDFIILTLLFLYCTCKCNKKAGTYNTADV